MNLKFKWPKVLATERQWSNFNLGFSGSKCTWSKAFRQNKNDGVWIITTFLSTQNICGKRYSCMRSFTWLVTSRNAFKNRGVRSSNTLHLRVLKLEWAMQIISPKKIVSREGQGGHHLNSRSQENEDNIMWLSGLFIQRPAKTSGSPYSAMASRSSHSSTDGK